MRRTVPALLVGSLLAAAPSLAIADVAAHARVRANDQFAVGYIGAESRLDGRPTTIMQVLPAQPTTTIAAGTTSIIYMNREGGTYTPSNGNDAGTNRSSIPTQTSTIARWNVSDEGWAQVMSCVRTMYARFDVEVTDVDPGLVPHIESVVAGSPADVQLEGNVGGISPFTTDCGMIDNAIVYTFAEVFGNDLETICEVVAQETAHAYGLDHAFLETDPMTYLNYDGLKAFQDETVSCGEFAPRACGLPNFPSCRPNQNSVALLAERLGLGSGDVAPTVSISSPADGATVPPGFTVATTASDDQGITRVELWIDGQLADSRTSAPYQFVTSASLGNGSHEIETRAYDASSQTSAVIEVTVQAGADPIDPVDPNDPNNPADPSDPNAPSGGPITGGCQVGGGAGGGLGLAGLALLGVLARRRRRS